MTTPLFGAICPVRGVGAALALPYADTDMMQLHLDEISRNVTAGAHAVLLLDRAGWHTTGKLDLPDNITPIFLPSRAPELNPVENVWQYLRQNWLSNTVFENYDAIVDAACTAWRNLTPSLKPSPPSECTNGLTSVSRYDLWYKLEKHVPSPTDWDL
jgi:transposase